MNRHGIFISATYHGHGHGHGHGLSMDCSLVAEHGPEVLAADQHWRYYDAASL